MKPIHEVEQRASPLTLPIKASLSHPILESIRSLNEFALSFPQAISLSAGMPAEHFFHPEELLELLPFFYDYIRKRHPGQSINKILGQYGPAAGLIREIVAEHLRVDYTIHAKPEEIILTLGCQEGLDLCTKVLFDEKDVLLIPEPIFIGITGSAIINNVALWPFDWDGAVFDERVFESIIEAVQANHKIPKAIYVIADYNNPHGTHLSLEGRKKLIAFAKKYQILIIEDATYAFFNYENEGLPSLKALGPEQVIYIGSAAKTIYPALRIGYLVASQLVSLEQKTHTLGHVFSLVKSFTSVHTPTMNQALFASLLLKNQYSLKEHCKPQIEFNKHNMYTMLSCLEEKFPPSLHSDVRWNKPQGGYFIILKLPFPFGIQEMRECAQNYNVLVTPMSTLSLYDRPRNEIRLAFTNVSAEEIKQGIANLASFVAQKLHSLTENVKAYDSV